MREEIEDFVRSLEDLQASRPQGVSLNTLLAYRSDLGQFVDFLERQGLATWNISSLDIMNYKRDLEARYAKPATRARKIAAVKAIYRYLVAAGRVPNDPIRNLDLPATIKRAPETLAREQLQRLVDSARVDGGLSPVDQAKGQRDYAMLAVLCATGLLASELVALNLGDYATGGTLELGAPSRRRSVSIDRETDAALSAYVSTSRLLLTRESNEPALFVNHRGGRLTRQGFWLIVKQCAERAGIEGISPRLLRHSCAAYKLTSGAGLRQVQELLGHAHASTTQAYVRARPVEALH